MARTRSGIAQAADICIGRAAGNREHIEIADLQDGRPAVAHDRRPIEQFAVRCKRRIADSRAIGRNDARRRTRAPRQSVSSAIVRRTRPAMAEKDRHAVGIAVFVESQRSAVLKLHIMQFLPGGAYVRRNNAICDADLCDGLRLVSYY